MPFATVLTLHGEQASPAPATTGPTAAPDGGDDTTAVATPSLQDGTPPTPAVGPVRWGGPTTVGAAGDAAAAPLPDGAAATLPGRAGLVPAESADVTAAVSVGVTSAPGATSATGTTGGTVATAPVTSPTPAASPPSAQPTSTRSADFSRIPSPIRASSAEVELSAESAASGGDPLPGPAARAGADAPPTSGRSVALTQPHAETNQPVASATRHTGAAVAAPFAPAPPSLPTTPAMPTPPAGPVHAVAATVQLATTRGFSHARLALNPPELGGVEVMLRSSSAGIVATLTADTPEAARLLEAGAGDLRRQLEGQGIELQRLEVDVSDRQATGEGAAAQAGDGRRDTAARGAGAGEPSRGGSDAIEADGAASDGRATRVDLGNGFLIDVIA